MWFGLINVKRANEFKREGRVLKRKLLGIKKLLERSFLNNDFEGW